MPDWGAWIRYEFNKAGALYTRIDLSPPFPLLHLFNAFECSAEEIWQYFSPELAEKAFGMKPSEDFQRQYEIFKGSFPNNTTPVSALSSRYEIFKLMRKNTIPNIVQADYLFRRTFFQLSKYNLSQVGRYNLNRKTDLDISADNLLIDRRDVMLVAKKLMDLQMSTKIDNFYGEDPENTADVKTDTIRWQKIMADRLTNLKEKNLKDCSAAKKHLVFETMGRDIDNIDSLDNKIIKPVGRQLVEYMRDGLLVMEKDIIEAFFTLQGINNFMPNKLIKTKFIISAITKFFNQNPLCQYAQQINILAELSQKRRITSTGRGGLDEDSATIEARDIQPTQYGRICPVETPEGKRIGLVINMATYGKVDPDGRFKTQYRAVKNGVVTNKLIDLLPEAEKNYIITDFTSIDESQKKLKQEDYLLARQYCIFGKEDVFAMNIINTLRDSINLVDVSPMQVVGPVASLVPFLNNTDSTRSVTGTSMLKQAVPLLRPDVPLIGTGMERIIAQSSTSVITAKHAGTVKSADATTILVRRRDNAFKTDKYTLKKYRGSNQGSLISQKTAVIAGDKVNEGDLLADCAGVKSGELALGHNVLMAYMAWFGYGYEDSIIVSERLVQNDNFTSIHIKKYEIDVMKTLLGHEATTKNVPNVSVELLKHLDDNTGIVKIGSYVRPGDYLVGKVMPKGEDSISPEERLIRELFGETAGQVEDVSLVVPVGAGGYVIDVEILDRKAKDKDVLSSINKELKREKLEETEEAKKRLYDILSKYRERYKDLLLISGNAVFIGNFDQLSLTQLGSLQVYCESQAPNPIKEKASIALADYQESIVWIDNHYREQRDAITSSDELPEGVLQHITVYIAKKRKVQVGDKMAGRYGNKGIVSRVLPVEDMPFLEDGTPIDVILNPMGVPSRMNIGQLFEAQFGLALWKLGQKIFDLSNNKNWAGLRALLKEIYAENEEKTRKIIDDMSISQLREVAFQIKDGVPIASPAIRN